MGMNDVFGLKLKREPIPYSLRRIGTGLGEQFTEVLQHSDK
jgi:hypothetical protein